MFQPRVTSRVKTITHQAPQSIIRNHVFSCVDPVMKELGYVQLPEVKDFNGAIVYRSVAKLSPGRNAVMDVASAARRASQGVTYLVVEELAPDRVFVSVHTLGKKRTDRWFDQFQAIFSNITRFDSRSVVDGWYDNPDVIVPDGMLGNPVTFKKYLNLLSTL